MSDTKEPFDPVTELPPAARALWAKTDSTGGRDRWLPLYVHAADACLTAQRIWDEQMSSHAKATLASMCGCLESDMRALVGLVAGLHDQGKASCFQLRAPEGSLARERFDKWFHGDDVPPDNACAKYRHAVLGRYHVYGWMLANGWTSDAAATQTVALAGHHGKYPRPGGLLPDGDGCQLNGSDYEGGTAPAPGFFGVTGLWRQSRDEIDRFVLSLSGADTCVDALRHAVLPQAAQALLTGIVIFADWISSMGAADVFPLLDPARSDLSLVDLVERADDSWSALGLSPAHDFAPDSDESVEELLKSSFPMLPEGARPSWAQDEAVRAARAMVASGVPGMIVVEDQTGEGKTEASLMAAEVLMRGFSLAGVGFYLHTCASTDAMLGRYEGWLDWLSHRESSTCGREVPLTMQFFHSRSRFNSVWSRIPRVGAGEESSAGVVAHRWFGSGKRRTLVPFAVATVDQALMAVLKAPHSALRQLGLANRVVVIDEVHVYDAYTSAYLDRLLSHLGSLRVPVILLSASLTDERREYLVNAYAGDRARDLVRERIGERNLSAKATTYPSVLSFTRSAGVSFAPTNPPSPRRPLDVSVSVIDDSDEALMDAVLGTAAQGGVVAVVRGTVGRAIATYDHLRDACEANGVGVVLLHSDMLAHDRAAVEAALVDALGPDGSRRIGGPNGLVVIGTSVLEASLNLDFDLMVSDVAPADSLIQRLGRLWRFLGTNRPECVSGPRLVLTGFTDELSGQAFPSFDRGVRAVYQADGVLARTIAWLMGRGLAAGAVATVSVPADVRSWLECAYGSDVPFDAWADALHHADDALVHYVASKRSAAEVFLQKPLSSGVHSPANARRRRKNAPTLIGVDGNKATQMTDEQVAEAQVRDISPSVQVILVRELGSSYVPVTGSPVDAVRHGGEVSLAQTEALLRSAVSIPVHRFKTRGRRPGHADARSIVSALSSSSIFDEWSEVAALSGCLPLAVDSDGVGVVRSDVGSWAVSYDRDRGVVVNER